MSTPPDGIPEADWLSWPPEAKAFILAQQRDFERAGSGRKRGTQPGHPGSGPDTQIGAHLLELQHQLFDTWYSYKDGTIGWPALQHSCRQIRLAFVATLQLVVELGYQRAELTPWAKTVRTCQPLLQVAGGLWTFLEIEGIEPTNNAAERALRQSVIQRKITGLPSNSQGVQSRQGAICRSRLLTVTTTLLLQGRDVWEFLEKAWIAHHRGGVMPALLPDH